MSSKLIEKYKKTPVTIRASLWFAACSILQRGISLITTPIFTRLISTEEYGIYTMYMSWLEIFSIFVTFKLSEAVFNKSMISVEPEDRRSTLGSYQLLILCLWSACFLLYCLFRTTINSLVKMDSSFMILMFSEILMTSIITLWSAYQRFEYKYKLLIAITLTIAILNPLLGITIIKIENNGAIGRIIGIVLSQLLVSIWLLFYNLKNVKKEKLFTNWLYAIRFNLPLIPHYLSQIILSQADRIMIGRMIGASEAALYGIAYTIGMLGTMITQSINNAYISWMYRELKKKNYNSCLSTNILLLVFLEVCIFCVFIIAPEAMYIIGGEKYLEATNVIYPVAISVSFMFTYGLFANIEYYFEKRIYVMIGTCASAVLNVALNFVFIQLYGYIAAAYTTLFCYFCYGAFHMIVVPKVIYKSEGVRIQIPYIKILSISLALIASSVFMQLLIPYPVIRYFILVILFAVAVIKRKTLFSYYKRFRNNM